MNRQQLVQRTTDLNMENVLIMIDGEGSLADKKLLTEAGKVV